MQIETWERLRRTLPEEADDGRGQHSQKEEIQNISKKGLQMLEAPIAYKMLSSGVARTVESCAELLICCCGRTEHEVDHKAIFSLAQGELLLLKKGTAHRVLFVAEGGLLVCIRLKEELLTAFLQTRLLGNLPDFLETCIGRSMEPVHSVLHYRVENDITVQNILENLLLELSEPEKGGAYRQRLLFELLFAYLSRVEAAEGKGTQGKYGDELLSNVMEYIDSNYRTANLTELAGRTNQTVYGLSKLIKCGTGRSFKALLQEKRLLWRLICFWKQSFRCVILSWRSAMTTPAIFIGFFKKDSPSRPGNIENHEDFPRFQQIKTQFYAIQAID